MKGVASGAKWRPKAHLRLKALLARAIVGALIAAGVWTRAQKTLRATARAPGLHAMDMYPASHDRRWCPAHPTPMQQRVMFSSSLSPTSGPPDPAPP